MNENVKTALRDIPRAADDEILRVLRLLQRGVSHTRTAAIVGMTRSRVSILKQRVLADDLRCSGEVPDVVRAGYEGRIG